MNGAGVTLQVTKNTILSIQPMVDTQKHVMVKSHKR
jgi:hypothetical protein